MASRPVIPEEKVRGLGFVAADSSVMGSVLVADADIDTRMLYCEAFAAKGWPCFEASDGREALVQAVMRKPSLCVTELWLPRIDGVALCEKLRRNKRTESLPILVITTDSRVDRIAQAYGAGANTVLGKPAALDKVIEAAAELIVSSQALRALVSEHREGLATAREKSRTLRADVDETIAEARRFRRKHRHSTRIPNTPPPALLCPFCDKSLAYELTHYGVSAGSAERWDRFVCGAGCGARFEYWFRTRSLRRL